MLQRLQQCDRNTQQNNQIFYIHVWQSRVEIEHYSVAYYDRITAFEALCAELQLLLQLQYATE